jgi:predicted site-specific integrase-resolvase
MPHSSSEISALGPLLGRRAFCIQFGVLIYAYTLPNMDRSAYAKHLGISYQTAWRMWQRGELPAHQLPSGTVIVDVPLPPPAVHSQKVAVYARVCSAEHRKNLDSQAERVAAFCAAKGWHVAKVVKECGSGVNDQRPQFLALLADPAVSHIVVEHKDRCSRFGVAYIQTLLHTQGRELVIINEAEEEADLLQDFVAIITSFCARLYGRRRASRKTTQLLAALEVD